MPDVNAYGEALGVPGNPGKTGRNKGGSGTVHEGQKSRNVSKGVNFHPKSAQFDPDPRSGVGKPAPHSKPTL